LRYVREVVMIRLIFECGQREKKNYSIEEHTQLIGISLTGQCFGRRYGRDLMVRVKICGERCGHSHAFRILGSRVRVRSGPKLRCARDEQHPVLFIWRTYLTYWCCSTCMIYKNGILWSTWVVRKQIIKTVNSLQCSMEHNACLNS
jgi:hypothetical protein